MAQLVEGWTRNRKVASSRLTAGSHCVVSLSKAIYLLLNTGSTKEDRKTSGHDLKVVDWDVKHQIKQTKTTISQQCFHAFYINSKHSVGQAAHHFLQVGGLTQPNSTTFTPIGGNMLEISPHFLNISKTMATSQLPWGKCFIQVCSTVYLLVSSADNFCKRFRPRSGPTVTSENKCTKYWLTACSSLPRKKCGQLNCPSRHDHSC